MPMESCIYPSGSRSASSASPVSRWQRKDGMGIQFRLLGARETHAITEIVRTQDTTD